ncbi:MAG: class I SAM-dependent methyltransferase [Patescibacteria group bacterium]
MNDKNNTSWGNSADWYDNLLNTDNDSYQTKVILPNVLRLLDIKKDDFILDIACGSGFFSREFYKLSKNVTGIDISKELINIAKTSNVDINFYVTSADDLKFTKTKSIDKAVCILAIQNIENVKGVLIEINRILKDNGKMIFILNHPAFRIPKNSSWIEDKNVRARRIDEYMSESKIKIEMHPGEKNSPSTISFHRPLQYYFKLFDNTGFVVKRLEEWNSHKISQNGPRKDAEDKARREFPMFMMIEIIKNNN